MRASIAATGMVRSGSFSRSLLYVLTILCGGKKSMSQLMISFWACYLEKNLDIWKLFLTRSQPSCHWHFSARIRRKPFWSWQEELQEEEVEWLSLQTLVRRCCCSLLLLCEFAISQSALLYCMTAPNPRHCETFFGGHACGREELSGGMIV